MQKEIKDVCFDYENCCLKNHFGITNNKLLRQVESDFAIVRIQEILKSTYFEPTIDYFKSLHKYLFQDVYPFAGIFRGIQIFKEEKVLAYLSVDYSKPENIEKDLNQIFDKMRNLDFNNLNKEEKIDYVTEMITAIWKVHAFREGNTRTVLVFLRQFLKNYGITFDPDLFKTEGNWKYTRTALVAASFEAQDLGVSRDYRYIRTLISDIIENSLTNERGVN